MVMNQDSKQALRALMKQRAKAFGQDREAEASALIMKRLEQVPEFAAARTVLMYMSIPGEVQTAGFIAQCPKRIAIPLVSGDELELRLYDPALLVPGYRGILEPSPQAARVDPSEIDFAVIPGVAFERKDGKVWRMGRGKGFYDRLLPRLHCPVWAAAFAYRLVSGLPLDPWDAPLDGIVTEI